MSTFRLRVDGTRFRDSHNREVTLRGINVSGDAKLPAVPDIPSHESQLFFDGDNVSFVGRPFTVSDADVHFARLRTWGYNTIRYVFTWEAIEHAGPGKYDEEWIQHTIQILRRAKRYGFYVYMDPHQDVWSRFTGGSGAPMWTLYACGLDPRKFAATQAALVQNTWPNPIEFPKMIWATNYTRLACQTMLTLFFGGREFAPKAIIDGMNIQDYLQTHFIRACTHLAQRLREAGDIENSVVIGWESMNEPNRGYIGWQDLSVLPPEQNMKKGSTPTAWQAMQTGSGRSVQVESWDFGNLGPYKSGSELVDPQGVSCWLDPDCDDTRYGWKRDPGWKLGECLWAQHGVWDPKTDTLLHKDYFSRHPSTGENISIDYYTNNFFLRHYRAFAQAIRNVFPSSIMFCQSSPFELPPLIKGTPDDDANMVYAAHFYDGITLITKKWNRLWNVDVLGIMRGRYLTPAFAVKIGRTAVRNCFRDQLAAMRKEGLDRMGLHPCVFTEIGIPYDMDNKQAYKDGNYTSQALAMDANHYALEGSNVAGYSIWVYVASNNHTWGDNWNGEDLSSYSVDDKLLPDPTDVTNTYSRGAALTSASSYADRASDDHEVTRKTMSLEQSTTTTGRLDDDAGSGYRAAEAFVRPSPIYTHGDIVNHGFDLQKCTFTLNLLAPSPTAADAPSEMFLPAYHFPSGEIDVDVTGGKWKVENVTSGDASLQVLRWWHAEGEQRITVRGVKSQTIRDEEEGYVDQCRQQFCTVM